MLRLQTDFEPRRAQDYLHSVSTKAVFLFSLVFDIACNICFINLLRGVNFWASFANSAFRASFVKAFCNNVRASSSVHFVGVFKIMFLLYV